MPSPRFVEMYHPALGNARALVSVSSIDDHALAGWLLVDGVTPDVATRAVRDVEAAPVVKPQGQWDFDQAPTVDGVAIGTGGGGGEPTTDASLLTFGTLDPDRIGNGTLPADKLTGTLSDSLVPNTVARTAAVTTAITAASNADRDRGNHTGTQDASTIVGTFPDNQIPGSIARDSEVATAVAAASTADRDRANHTGTQPSTTLSDATSVGRSVLTAATATAARTAIGAGTSSLTQAQVDSTSATAVATSTKPIVRLGVFTEAANPNSLAEYETAAGEPATAVLVAYNFTQQPNAAVLNAHQAAGRVPMIAWMANGASEAPADNAAYKLSAIIAGNHDSYLSTFLTAIKNLGYPVMIRLMHEMNGNWYSWSEQTNGNSAGQYAQAWRHIVDLARAQGVTNVEWVWAPSTNYDGSPALAPLYPGNAYVDIVAVNGYNWGSGHISGWRTPQQVFDSTFTEIRAIRTGKPLWLAETGSESTGGDKAAWITAFFDWLLVNNIAGFIWFNSSTPDEVGADWRVNSTAATAAAFTAGVAKLRRTTRPTGAVHVPSAVRSTRWTGRQDFTDAEMVGVPTTLPTPEQIGAAPAVRTINFFTAAHTLAPWNQGRQITFDTTAAVTLTVPVDASLTWPIGVDVDVAQSGTGQVTIAAAAGGVVTVESRGDVKKLAGRYAYATLRKVAANRWHLFGDLVA